MIKRTTVGRFWGYVSVFIALGVSLAGNFTAAFITNPDPSWVELSIGGIPPLAAFLVIELANHNPWKHTTWGPTVMTVLLVAVAPASAVVSFIHLVHVVIHDQIHDTSPAGILTWTTAVLTALLIDGLMFGGTAALLLPVRLPTIPVERGLAITPSVDWRLELQETLKAERARWEAEQPLSAPAAKVKSPARKPSAPREGGNRLSPEDHPAWPDFVAARAAGQPWDAAKMADETGKERAAARAMLARWNNRVSV